LVIELHCVAFLGHWDGVFMTLRPIIVIVWARAILENL
jgi:hypothetical protein